MSNKNKVFISTFEALKSILKKYEKNLSIISDEKDKYDLNAGYSEKYKKIIYFGGVHVTKNYVSFHLMSVYMYPKMLDDLSSELKKRMQGKSCFNFSTIDKNQLSELATLTKRSFEFYKKNNLL